MTHDRHTPAYRAADAAHDRHTPAYGGGGAERATPFYCPYCADEDLRPVEEPHGAWRCTSCLRVFVVRFVGLTASQASTGGTP